MLQLMALSTFAPLAGAFGADKFTSDKRYSDERRMFNNQPPYLRMQMHNNTKKGAIVMATHKIVNPYVLTRVFAEASVSTKQNPSLYFASDVLHLIADIQANLDSRDVADHEDTIDKICSIAAYCIDLASYMVRDNPQVPAHLTNTTDKYLQEVDKAEEF